MPSTRTTPNWSNTADATASDPARWAVCDMAVDSPSVLRPTFTATIGTPRCRAWSAAASTVAPSLKPSM